MQIYKILLITRIYLNYFQNPIWLNENNADKSNTFPIAKDYLMLPLKSAINRHSLIIVSKDTRIKFSKLGKKGGPIGACMLSRSRPDTGSHPTCSATHYKHIRALLTSCNHTIFF